MAIFLGTQPRGLQINFGRQPYKICDKDESETKEHIMLQCTGLNDIRERYLEIVKSLMPPAMLVDFLGLNISNRCHFLISGLNNIYVNEWDNLYGAIADYVWQIYSARNLYYIAMRESLEPP